MTTSTESQSALTQAQKNEAILARLRAQGVYLPPPDAWKQTIGWAKDDPLHAEAVKAGAAWRAEENRRSIEEWILEHGDS